MINVELLEGLERIDCRAFGHCTSLTSIRIPSTVNYIRENACSRCERLLAIEFSDEIGQFVDEVPLPWWNRGVSKASLRTYSFLARFKVLARLGTIQVQKWKENIHNMLQRIPEEDSRNNMEADDKVWDDNFDSIEHRLSDYEQAQEVAPLLELALWKVKIMEQWNGNLINDDAKLLCRIDSFSMFAIIFPNVISFLFHEYFYNKQINSCGLNEEVLIVSDVITLTIKCQLLIYVLFGHWSYHHHLDCYLATNASISVTHTPIPGIWKKITNDILIR